MDGEKKFYLILVCSTIISICVLASIALIILWEHREPIVMLALTLVVLSIVSGRIARLTGQFNEQRLRRKRVLYHNELPLDQEGQPYYYPQQMQQYEKPLVQPKYVEEYGYKEQH